MKLPRTVTAETLDHLAPHDPAAQRSRRDLMRIHRAMGTRSIVARAWRDLVPPGPVSRVLKVLEIGAGDGTLLLRVARAIAPHWPHVQLTLLDRQHITSQDTLAGFAALGWSVQMQRADVLSWASENAMPDSERPHWDLITTALFLHHFETTALEALLAAVAVRSDRFLACEPKRAWLPLAASHLVGAIGANAVTREDAVLSVHAGFRDQELTSLWPATEGWQTRESAAGLFSHVFSAQRAQIAR